MSGALHPPLLAPEQAGKLLEEVIYERVLSFVDLEGLFDFERELWCAYDEAGVADEEDVPALVKALIDRAIVRLCDEPRRYVDFSAPFQPFPVCELCEQEANEAATAKRKTS
ncbi:MAG TPA: hypothetical protein VL326_22120 [Kofleriaceae bacterium]|nr:hypothetical protein [Kofleriaceae bacterium]